MADLVVKRGNLLPWVESTLIDDDTGEPVDLTSSTAARFVMRSYSSPSPELDAAAEVLPGGKVRYKWQSGDTDGPLGRKWAEWVVTFPDGEQTFPNPTHIYIDFSPSVADMPRVDEADVRAVRQMVGGKVPPTDLDIALRLDALGSVERVALEILEGRLSAMLAGPAKWSIDGDASFDYTETIKALRGQVSGLQQATGSLGAVAQTAVLTRADRER